ncbi:alpha/beta fold hydrolase [Streptomyces sp. NPDC004126]|uniref:alpha/beta fold hydrolase n=1 Tax=Streptomyces sp. NPDC004126 TaxID=3390695 RepID=UPI003CFEF7F7
MTWAERVAVRDGVRLSCRDWGDPGGSGPAVVLLHGLAGHAGEWDAVARALSPRHRVVAVDQRGHGASERRPRDVSRAAYVEDAVAVCEGLGLREPVLVGQSLGGHTAMLAAAAHPGLFRGLVLVEAGPGGPSPGVQAEIGGWLDSWPTPFPSREAAVGFLGGGPVGEGWAAGLEELDGGWWPRFEPDVMVGSLAENARRAFWDEWSRVSCPTLAVLGQSGTIAPDEVGGMLRLRPEAVAVSVPGTGHDVHLERPDVLLDLLRGFLQDVGDGREDLRDGRYGRDFRDGRGVRPAAGSPEAGPSQAAR